MTITQAPEIDVEKLDNSRDKTLSRPGRQAKQTEYAPETFDNF